MSNIKKVKFLTTSFVDRRYRLIYTGLTGPVNLEILESVKGQLSDGIWENSPSMNKVWRNFSVVNKGGVIFLNVDNYYPSPFGDKTDQEVLKYFAIKIKQIIKVEQDDGYDVVWERNCKEISAYFGNRDTPVTVADAYKAYDTLLGRATTNKKYESTNKPLSEANVLDSDNSNIDIDQFFSRGGGNIWADCDKYTLRRNCKKEPDIRWALFKGDDWTSRNLVLVLPFTSLNEMMNFEYSLPEVCWKGSFSEDDDYPEDTPETSDLYFDEIIKRFGKGKVKTFDDTVQDYIDEHGGTLNESRKLNTDYRDLRVSKIELENIRNDRGFYHAKVFMNDVYSGPASCQFELWDAAVSFVKNMARTHNLSVEQKGSNLIADEDHRVTKIELENIRNDRGFYHAKVFMNGVYRDPASWQFETWDDAVSFVKNMARAHNLSVNQKGSNLIAEYPFL